MTQRILGSLSVAEGAGVLRLEDRFDAGIDELWSALTQPERLAGWLGEITGALQLGGTFSGHLFSSGWQGTGQITACDPPGHFAVTMREDAESAGTFDEAWLTPDGDGTILVLEQRGLPLAWLAAFGAGGQTHFEDLAEHVAGRGRVDAAARFAALHPLYEAQVARLDRT
jgi:uncharacterized protein YndB with AHSA1/START domain